MNHCARCSGRLLPVTLLDLESTLEAWRCVSCGHVCGEALLDRHHALLVPPPPRADIRTPTWNPHRRRLVYIDPLCWEEPGELRQALDVLREWES